MKKESLMVLAASWWLASAATAVAQSAAGTQSAAATGQEQHVISSEDLQLLRQDIRSQRKQLIAQNLSLTDTDATKFWPIYDKYLAELTKVNDKKYAALQEYADHYGTLSDDHAVELVKQWQDVDIEAAQLRSKYVPLVAKAIGGRKAAAFAQLDRRIAMMIELQLSSKVPIVQH